jgi:hypothetical protein
MPIGSRDVDWDVVLGAVLVVGGLLTWVAVVVVAWLRER